MTAVKPPLKEMAAVLVSNAEANEQSLAADVADTGSKTLQQALVIYSNVLAANDVVSVIGIIFQRLRKRGLKDRPA